MKRSRIICSITAVIYILLSVFLIFMLVRSNMYTKSNLSINFKAIYIAVFGVITLMYVWVKNKLTSKVTSIKLINIYCYFYLAIIVFVTRLVMAYVLNNNVGVISPSFEIGLGSYISYLLGVIIGKQMYANIIINTVITYVSCVLIKKIMLNITESDIVATMTSIAFVLIPQSLMYVNEYVRYNYNVLVILTGIMLIMKIIDKLKDFNIKNNRYLIYAVILGVIQLVDILLGGSYVFWIIIMLLITIAAMYVDTTYIRFADKLKCKFNYKIKILLEKIERVNISKLVYVTLITLGLSGMGCIVCLCLNINNFTYPSLENITNILMSSRNYYIVLLVFALVFEIIGLILKRKVEIKMFVIKSAMLALILVLPFMEQTVYTSQVFDMILVLTAVINICNICYNREERVKLLKDKN